MRTIGSSSLAVETGAPVMLNHRGEPMVPTRRVLKSQSLPPPSATLYGASGRGYDLRQRASKKRSARKFSALMEDDPELLAILYPIKKKQRSDNSSAADLFDSGASDAPLHVATPFDEHLRAIYDGQADDGLAFFESHGYYDVDDANTVEMFRKNFDLDSTGFWVDRYGRHRLNSSSSSSQDSADLEHDEFSLSSGSSAASECFNTDINPFVGSFVRSASMRVMSSRRQPHSSTRGRSASRFALLDDEGNEVDYDLYQDEEFEDEDDEIERMARELRLKARSLAMDADDVAELERDQRAMVRAVAVIRSEKSQLQRLLFEAFANGEAVTVTINGVSPTIQFPTLRTMNATPPPPSIPQSVQPAAVDVESLPPYCGNVHVLRDSVPFLLGSGWRKRWFCLDFQEGVVTMFKRSYWKAPRGALDLRGVARIEKMGRADFRIEFLPHSSDCEPAVLMLRAKNAEDADMWVSLLRFARRNVRLSSASAGSSERALVIAKQKTSGHNNHANNNAKKGNKQVDMYTRILEMANQQQLRPSLPSSTAVARSSLTA